jgi:transcriptional regulator with XRE-family HTH domain
MAELLGCSTSTIHSLESGRLKLSDSLAVRMGLGTGVNINWLRARDTSKAPTTLREGRRYSRSEFEDWLLNETETLRLSKTARALDIIEYLAQVRAILESANKRGDYIMARYKVGIAIDALRDRFGQDRSCFANPDPTGILARRSKFRKER